MKKNLFTIQHRQAVFIIIVLVCIALNLFYLIPHLKAAVSKRAKGPYPFYGRFFTEIKDKLEKVWFMGYCTDKNLDEQFNNAVFTQAQYELAPIVLIPNSLDHNYLFFSYQSEEKALSIINTIKASALVKNKLNIILAEKQPWYY